MWQVSYFNGEGVCHCQSFSNFEAALRRFLTLRSMYHGTFISLSFNPDLGFKELV